MRWTESQVGLGVDVLASYHHQRTPYAVTGAPAAAAAAFGLRAAGFAGSCPHCLAAGVQFAASPLARRGGGGGGRIHICNQTFTDVNMLIISVLYGCFT